MADYLPDNLAEITKWRERAPDAFSWRPYTEMALREEGTAMSEDVIAAREDALRHALGTLRHCDVRITPPVSGAGQFPVVLTFYCAEEVGTTVEAWKRVMASMASMVAPGGLLLLSALRDADRYMLGDPNGAHEWLPSAPVTATLLSICLAELGFLPESMDIRSADTPSLVPFGIPGILVAAARKRE
jgi:hypothetical protein